MSQLPFPVRARRGGGADQITNLLSRVSHFSVERRRRRLLVVTRTERLLFHSVQAVRQRGRGRSRRLSWGTIMSKSTGSKARARSELSGFRCLQRPRSFAPSETLRVGSFRGRQWRLTDEYDPLVRKHREALFRILAGGKRAARRADVSPHDQIRRPSVGCVRRPLKESQSFLAPRCASPR
jgi:hypothetical protein